ncbi:hypothetical protein ABVK25_012243 [Lepraria finkii]|uniref:Uncharacterized protein n=1 Tax=Lepraria finkii TaxID=1340010 RepID=A0ABR4AK94_9LECA
MRSSPILPIERAVPSAGNTTALLYQVCNACKSLHLLRTMDEARNTLRMVYRGNSAAFHGHPVSSVSNQVTFFNNTSFFCVFGSLANSASYRSEHHLHHYGVNIGLIDALHDPGRDQELNLRALGL